MKIRIKANSIRFRLTKTEVKNFCKNGRIEEQTDFDGSIFSYSVVLVKNAGHLTAVFEYNTIALLLPEEVLGDWATNDQVGFKNTMKVKNGKELFLLLEKDFTCLDNTIEDQSDNYPNPKAQ